MGTPNGPNYIATTWDGDVGIRTTNLATFTDGTSNTAIFSKWVKGSAANSSPKLSLRIVYCSGVSTGSCPTDLQFNQACAAITLSATATGCGPAGAQSWG
jgi:hypothetical protein